MEKIAEVTKAQKEFEVAELDAKKVRAMGEAEATANKLKVMAGLTPLEKATIEKETRIGVAAEMAKVVFPTTMILTGGGANGSSNPFDAIGLNAFYELTRKMSEGAAAKK